MKIYKRANDGLLVLDAPETEGYVGKWDPKFSVRSYLESISSGLALVRFVPPADLAKIVCAPLVEHDWATWANRVCKWFGCGQRYLITTGACEQNAIRMKRVLNPEFRIVAKINQSQKPRAIAGTGLIRTRDGWLRFVGEWKAAAFTGYGIPDPNTSTSFKVKRYLGIARQTYWTAYFAKRERKYWADGERTVMLYSKKKGGKPRKAIAMQCNTRLMIRYTPSIRELTHRPSVKVSLFRAYDGKA